MSYKYSLPYFLLAFLYLTWLAGCNLTAQKSRQNIEGYVILDIKTFTDADSNGFAQKPISGNDSMRASSHRKIYLQNNCLIDVVGNLNFNNGEYIKTDTLSYNFYDLVDQKYILFEKLTANAKIIKRGNMTIDGSFSNTVKYDPMNGVVDTTMEID